MHAFLSPHKRERPCRRQSQKQTVTVTIHRRADSHRLRGQQSPSTESASGSAVGPNPMAPSVERVSRIPIQNLKTIGVRTRANVHTRAVLGTVPRRLRSRGGGSRFVLGARVRSTWKVLLGGTATPEAVGASLSSSRGWFFEEIDQCTLTRPCQNKSHFASTRSLQSRRGSARRSEASCVSIRCPSRSSDATQKSQVATDTRRRARGR